MYNGRKVIITVLDEDKTQFRTIPNEELYAVSDSLINQNMEAYKEIRE
ncbi:hypothetical protein H0R92_04300 [Treponema sp. OMZ 840]